jgi:hypothetical protein
MSTPLAVRNQANAQHSTGPRTPRGKAVACRNALQHGLLSDLPIATAGERREDWDQHCTQVCAALAPLGHLETVLAERAALLLWRQVRIARYETAMIDQGLVALEASVHGHRFALADARPSTAADLRARRDDLAQLMNLVNAVSEADPAAGFDAAEAQQILAAFLSTPECSSLPPTVLPARGKPSTA